MAALHAEAFAELCGVPTVVVPDNLKSAVIRAAFGMRDEPVLNRSYRDLARHFGFKIDPTPAYSPEKKGKVESGVKYVKRNFFGARADERDASVLAGELTRWVNEIAGMRRHGTTQKRPLELFEQVEQQALLPLPATKWEPVVWRTPTLRRDCHALVDGGWYSAPWRLVGRVLLARCTKRSVVLFWEDVRVATHDRVAAGTRSTVDEHLPEHRSQYRHRARSYWEQRADQLAPEIGAYVREIFDSDDVLNQLTKVQAIVAHLETFPLDRAVAAARRASFFGSYSYQAIKNILRKGLDMTPLPTVVVPESAAAERPRFARDIQELLQFPTEKNDAPH